MLELGFEPRCLWLQSLSLGLLIICTESHCILQSDSFRSPLQSSNSLLSPPSWDGKVGLFSKNHEDSEQDSITFLFYISGFCSMDVSPLPSPHTFFYLVLLLLPPLYFSWVKCPSFMWKFMEWGWELYLPDLSLSSCGTLGKLFSLFEPLCLICKVWGGGMWSPKKTMI